MAAGAHPRNGLGLGVDAGGGPTYDPSANVIALTDAANKRQDDLREAFEKYHQRELECLKELSRMRAIYETRLSEAESKRIDAIRAVDVQAVAVASERQTAAATVLANQVSISADALRTLVSTTASTIAEQSRIQMVQITDRLTAVERSQYEGRGKAGMADPMIAELVVEMKSLRESRAGYSAKSEGGQDLWRFIAVGLTLLIGILGLVFSFMKSVA